MAGLAEAADIGLPRRSNVSVARYFRMVAAEEKRKHRAAAREFREWSRRERELQKQAAKMQAADDVEQYERYLELLVSLHRDCGGVIDWAALADASPPVKPVRLAPHEQAATAMRDSYKPGLVDRMFGGAKKKQSAFENEIARARVADDEAFAQAMGAFQASQSEWNSARLLGSRMVARDSSVFAQALRVAGSFDELEAFGTAVTASAEDANGVVFRCVADDEIVPREELKLTAGGKKSSKQMAATKYWPLYQDHLCSAALRLGREAFAVLPSVDRAIVNIGPRHVNTSTGHREEVTFLAVHFSRSGLGKLNLAQIDPSDSMKNFPHRMKFKKGSGFEPVEPITLEEQWVTT